MAPFLYRLGLAQVTGVLDLLPNAGAAEALWIERGSVFGWKAADPAKRPFR